MGRGGGSGKSRKNADLKAGGGGPAAEESDPLAGTDVDNPYSDNTIAEMAHALAMTDWDGYKSGLTDAEVDAIQQYGGNDYQKINSWLRGLAPDRGMAGIEKLIDRAIDKGVTARDLTLYRGVGDPAALGLSGAGSVGQLFRDKGYVSTSLSARVARDFSETNSGYGAVVKFVLPKGSKAAYIDATRKTDSGAYETEVVLPRGTSFRITGHSKRGDISVYTATVVRRKK